MKILVCGAGALGSALGGMLADAGHDVTFLGFGEHIRAVAERGLDMEGLWGERHVSGIRATEKADEVDAPDWIILSTKSTHTREAIASIASKVQTAQAIFCPQNGIGNEEMIAEVVGWPKILGGMVIIGFEILSPGRVKVTVSADSIKVGRMGGPADEIARTFGALLQTANIPSEVVDHVERFKWAKLLYNSALNPLGAILKVRYGQLLDPEPWAIIEGVVREAFQVTTRKNLVLAWGDAEAYLHHLRTVQIPATAGHRASMLQDLDAGRRTEIDTLNGVLVKMGKDLKVSTPVNETLVHLIKSLEGFVTAASSPRTS